MKRAIPIRNGLRGNAHNVASSHDLSVVQVALMGPCACINHGQSPQRMTVVTAFKTLKRWALAT